MDKVVIDFAENKYHLERKKDFLFQFDYVLYYAKALKSGKVKVKEICTGLPKLISFENRGNKDESKWLYKFAVESKHHHSVEILLELKELSSNYTFKKSILKRIPVLFIGSKSDFDFFIREEIKRVNL